MKLLKEFANWFWIGSSAKIYDSIEELPIWNWMQIQKTADLSYMYKLKDYRKMPLPKANMEELWMVLYNEYIKEFGLNEQYEKYLQRKKKIAIMKCDHIITDDNIHKTLIKIEEVKLADMMDKRQLSKFIDVMAILEKFLGFQMDPKQISVLKYYSYLRYLEKSVKASTK